MVSFQSKEQEISNLLQGLDGSAIIYVMTKKEAETLANYVRNTRDGPPIAVKHLGALLAFRYTVSHRAAIDAH